MTDVPLIFTGPMIRALLDGRKTMTRRLDVERWRSRNAGTRVWVRETWQTGMGPNGPQIAYRATPDYFDIDAWDGPDEGIGPSFNYDKCPGATWHTNLGDLLSGAEGAWRSPIHMPRWASRLTLLVESVKVERLQDISEADALAEGCFQGKATGRIFENPGSARLGSSEWANARDWYADLWESLHGEDAWTANPWVAAITFGAIKSNIDALPAPAAEQSK